MKVLWFDTETSGLDEKKHGIISLAYMVEIDGEIKETGELFSDCSDKALNEFALQVNGFTKEQIFGFPPAKTMYKDLIKVFDRYVDRYKKEDKFIAAGYNVQFDIRFLRQLWEDCNDKYFGSWFAFGAIDPSQILRFLEYAKGESQAAGKLVDVAKAYGIDTEDAHDALADIRMTKAVTEAIIEELGL